MSKKKKVLNIKCDICLIFFPSTTFSETFLVLRRIEGDIVTNVRTAPCKASYRHSCQISMKLEFPRQISGKILNTKFHENPSGGSPVVPCERTDGRTDGRTYFDEVICRFSQFCQAPICYSKSTWRRPENEHRLNVTPATPCFAALTSNYIERLQPLMWA
jgi:hypothetical protein